MDKKITKTKFFDQKIFADVNQFAKKKQDTITNFVNPLFARTENQELTEQKKDIDADENIE